MNTFNNESQTVIATLKELGHPVEVSNLTTLDAGVILISGKHGSGKSTTLAAFAKAVNEDTGKNVVEIGTADDSCLGLPYFKIAERKYPKISRGSKKVDIEAARRFVLIETAAILNQGVEVAVFDDLRHPESALIASYLVGAGVLVIASIHNSTDVPNAVNDFTALTGKLGTSTISQGLVTAVMHQTLVPSQDNSHRTLKSLVYRP